METVEKKGWFDWTANILSWILAPILIPVYGILLIFNFSLLAFVPWESKLVFTLITLGINGAFAMICFYFLKIAGVVNDLGINDRKERLIPYILSIFCLCTTAWVFYSKGAPLWVSMFYLGGAAAALINLIVNFWWKISAHAAGMAGLVALMMHLWRFNILPSHVFEWLIAIILLTGLLGSCRIWLGRHTCGQVLAGYAVGFTSVYLLMMITP